MRKSQYSMSKIYENIDTPDYDIIQFEYSGRDNPNYDDLTYSEEPTIQASDLQKEFLENYQSNNEDNYIFHTVEEEDSLIGLELKFDIKAEQIMNINNISENSLFKGMIIKIPKKNKLLLQETKKQKTIQIEEKNNLFEKFAEQKSRIFDIFYITQFGQIRGQLTVHEEILFFDPDLNDNQNIKLSKEIQKKNVSSFQFQLLVQNIIKLEQKQLPTYITDDNQIIKDKIIQLYIQTKKCKVIVLKLLQINDLLDFLSIINESISKFQPFTPIQQIENTPKQQQLKSLIPFYYLNDENLEFKIQEDIQKSLQCCFYISHLESQSELINQDNFMKIVCYFPILYKSQHWDILYSTSKHGFSIETLIRNTIHKNPVVLLIKDTGSFLFGAYLSEGIHKQTDKFYGNGESFLFTFKNTEDIIVYQWMGNNNYVTLCDNDGLAIGCGDKYGLYLDQELFHGYSHYCETFNNDILSSKDNFVIERIEVWGLQIY